MYRREAVDVCTPLSCSAFSAWLSAFLAWVLERSVAGQHSVSFGVMCRSRLPSPNRPAKSWCQIPIPAILRLTGGLVRAASGLVGPGLVHRRVTGFGFVGVQNCSNLRRWAVRTRSHTGIRWLQVGQSTVSKRITISACVFCPSHRVLAATACPRDQSWAFCASGKPRGAKLCSLVKLSVG